VNTDYGYRMPYVESQAQNERAQISLIDEEFAEYMFRQNFVNLRTVFANELVSIDSDVYQLQIAFANTILMSPIAGTVTVLYKYPGDAVRAGEPVMRVENNTEVLLSATLVCRGRIAIGANATVETRLFDMPGPDTPFSGQVVAVRGHHEDDRWDVIIKCANLDGAGQPILPPGYHFDYDDTTVTLT
jgi:multidrug resistance efflux pump